MIIARYAGVALMLTSACATIPAPEGIGGARSADEFTLRLNERQRILDTDLSVVSFQDSRCPSGVRCIHAGTVTLHVSHGGAAQTRLIRLGDSLEVQGLPLKFVEACPYPIHNVVVPPERYRFTFSRLRGMEEPVTEPIGPCTLAGADAQAREHGTR